MEIRQLVGNQLTTRMRSIKSVGLKNGVRVSRGKKSCKLQEFCGGKREKKLSQDLAVFVSRASYKPVVAKLYQMGPFFEKEIFCWYIGKLMKCSNTPTPIGQTLRS
jgi:hypothetical protein